MHEGTKCTKPTKKTSERWAKIADKRRKHEKYYLKIPDSTAVSFLFEKEWLNRKVNVVVSVPYPFGGIHA